jgi:hypothetical protein
LQNRATFESVFLSEHGDLGMVARDGVDHGF